LQTIWYDKIKKIKMTKINSYGELCAEFYDVTKKFAPPKEVDFYERFIKKDGKTLEAMSGSGRLQIPLILKGHEVHGVDTSPEMIENCKKRARQLNIETTVFEQSLDSMLLPNTYDTVTIAVGSFQLLTDKNKAFDALKNIRAHMTKNGNLLIDFFIPATDNQSAFTREAIIDENTKIRLTTRYKFDLEKCLAYGFCDYEKLINNKVQKKEEEIIEVCWYKKGELEELLTKAGFEVVQIYTEKFRESGESDIIHARAV
jgi:SAM-dependent methyltransferase